MIYTVTFNPSLDYIVSVDDFKLGLTNRTSSELMLPGGKGINVSIVLKNLGIESTALGFMAGFTGKEIARRLKEDGVTSDFIQIEEGISRINLKLKSIDGTEINGSGPEIPKDKVEELMDRLNTMKEGDILFLAGSIPASMPDDIYSRIMKLGEIFGVTLKTREEVIPYGRKLQEKGARNVLISMAGEGAVLIAENGEVYSSPAPKGTLVNGVGAGDSMVAGFMAGWMEKQDYEHAFHMGVATGSASAFSEYLATRPEVEEVYKQLV